MFIIRFGLFGGRLGEGGGLAVWMADDFGDFGFASGAYFPVESFYEVDASSDEFPSPAFVAYTVVPELLTSERRYRVCCIPYEATSGMRIQGEKKRDE